MQPYVLEIPACVFELWKKEQLSLSLCLHWEKRPHWNYPPLCSKRLSDVLSGRRWTFPARRFDRTFFWELQRKFKPLTTSGGSETHGKDTVRLQNSERTNKVQGGHKKRSFRKSCGEGANIYLSFHLHASAAGYVGQRLITENIIWCQSHCKFALSSKLEGGAVCSQRRLSQMEALDKARDRIEEESVRFRKKPLKLSVLRWRVNQQHTAASLLLRHHIFSAHVQLKHS